MEIKSVELANNEFDPVTALGEHVLLCNRYFYIILISSFLWCLDQLSGYINESQINIKF